MVKKLFKHEIFAYLKTLTPVYIILCGIALMARLLQFFENGGTVYKIIFGSATVVYVISIIVAIILTLILVITRFYKNMFSSEGYLTHTLPVTADQHIIVKTVTAVLFQLITVFAVLISACIITAGELLKEILKAIAYMYNFFNTSFEQNLAFYIIEVVLMLLIALTAEILLFYAVISVGQLFRKNRVIAAIGVYFGYYIVTQIIGTVLVVAVTLLANTELMSAIVSFISANPFKTAHIAFIAFAVFYAVLAAVYYLITSIIVRKKLNLE